MATKKTVDGIRDYLNSLGQDNKPIVNKEAVKSLKADIKGTSDPIEKLRLMAQLESEEAGVVPDNSGLEAVFVAEAKDWAEEEGISVASFQALGVPDDVLRRAKFDVLTGGRKPSASITSSRKPRVPYETYKEAAIKLGSGWKVSDLGKAIDRDPGTATTYVKKLVADGVIKVVGDDPNHDGRGRAPKLYAKA